MDKEIEAWRFAGADLEIEIVAPIDLQLSNGASLHAAALVRGFGAKNGMVVHPDYKTLEPHVRVLVKDGYGYSAVSMGAYSERR